MLVTSLIFRYAEILTQVTWPDLLIGWILSSFLSKNHSMYFWISSSLHFNGNERLSSGLTHNYEPNVLVINDSFIAAILEYLNM